MAWEAEATNSVFGLVNDEAIEGLFLSGQSVPVEADVGCAVLVVCCSSFSVIDKIRNTERFQEAGSLDCGMNLLSLPTECH